MSNAIQRRIVAIFTWLILGIAALLFSGTVLIGAGLAAHIVWLCIRFGWTTLRG